MRQIAVTTTFLLSLFFASQSFADNFRCSDTRSLERWILKKHPGCNENFFVKVGTCGLKVGIDGIRYEAKAVVSCRVDSTSAHFSENITCRCW